MSVTTAQSFSSKLKIASAVEQMVLSIDPNFEKDQTNAAGTLIIHDMLIPDPFSLKTVNNFSSSPPFGLFDIFNHLIYHSTDYDKNKDSPLTSHLMTIYYSMTVM